MLQDALMAPQFFVRLHFPQSKESGCASKLTADILKIYETEVYNLFFQTLPFGLQITIITMAKQTKKNNNNPVAPEQGIEVGGNPICTGRIPTLNVNNITAYGKKNLRYTLFPSRDS
jgi:hypothetical protein